MYHALMAYCIQLSRTVLKGKSKIGYKREQKIDDTMEKEKYDNIKRTA